MSYIDLHCHVLPGLDDGPMGMDASIEMVRALLAEGVGTVVATPHLRADYPDVDVRSVPMRCADLQARAAAADAAIDVVAGGEVSLDWALHASPSLLRAATLAGNGRDLLVETPYGFIGPSFEPGVMAIMRAGYRVTLAHPELNADLQDDPSPLQRLLDAGTLLQVSARSLLRDRRKSKSAALARALVREGRAHVIATDAHSAGPWRAPDLRRGVLEAVSLAGPRGEWMATDAPAAILAGGPLPAAAPQGAVAPRRRRFSLAQ